MHTFTCCIISLLCLIVLAACRGMANQVAAPTPTIASEIAAETTNRAVLEGNTETTLPQGATAIRGYINGFRDVVTYLRFQIPAADLDPFLASTLCTLPLQITDQRAEFQHALDRAWWMPATAHRSQWCSGANAHLGQQILIDMTNRDQYIVYVIAGTH